MTAHNEKLGFNFRTDGNRKYVGDPSPQYHQSKYKDFVAQCGELYKQDKVLS